MDAHVNHPATDDAPADLNILKRFALKMIPEGQPKRREFLDGFMVPRGKAMILALDHGQGKTTAILTALVGAAATGVFNLFGSKDHGRKLKCLLVTGEETEEDFVQKFAYDAVSTGGRPTERLAMARAAIAAGNLVLVSLDMVQEKTGSFDRVFGEMGDLTPTGKDIFNAAVEGKFDVVVLDTMRSVGSGDYNQEIVASRTLSAMNKLARIADCAVIMTAHVTKDAQKAKLEQHTPPAQIINLIRGSGQIVSQARHVVVLMEDNAPAFNLPTLKTGDKQYVMALKSNLGVKSDVLMPVVRSAKSLTFEAYANGKSLLDVSVGDDKWRYMRLLDLLPKLIFASSISGHPLTINGAFSPEKLSESTLATLLPAGTTSSVVSSAIKTLLSKHEIVQVKTTDKGAPSRYDVASGPYASAAREGIDPPASRGAPDTKLLKFAASAECVVFTDILDFALRESNVDASVLELFDRNPIPGTDFVPSVQEEAADEPAGMDEMPEDDQDDGGEYVPNCDMSDVDLSDATRFEI